VLGGPRIWAGVSLVCGRQQFRPVDSRLYFMVVKKRVDGILGRNALDCIGFAHSFLTRNAAFALLNVVLMGN
jgi:hypothetical protein